MASKLPAARQVNSFYLMLQFVLMGLIIFIYFLAGARYFLTYGALTYLTIYYSLSRFIPLSHRTAMQLMQKRQFRTAIVHFRKSYLFFSKNAWLDKYRCLMMFSSSKMCYREIDLNNIAFCYGQIGDNIRTIEYYKRLNAEFPDNELAKAALNFIETLEKGLTTS
ncbi:hypothetical protein [Agriterribacter sp.]|uniref:hypothetical protein n=1 Tax=Agriterribacter sp. TaxID=2821509 RepID=UPI002C511525|nr:hypothetical protein [Agriterribacter sp.]HRP58053.1 hypothetical protein [Agriterribacter sp.]